MDAKAQRTNTVNVCLNYSISEVLIMTLPSLKLEKNMLLGAGRFRSTYSHPHFSNRIIKVVHNKKINQADLIGSRNQNIKNLLKKAADQFGLRRPRIVDPNERELFSIGKLKQLETYDEKFFAEFFGRVDTNFGEGLVFQKFGARENEVFLLLSDKCQRQKALSLISKDELLMQYDKLQNLFALAKLRNAGVGYENLGVLVRKGEQPHLVCFDIKVFQDKRLIPFDILGSLASQLKKNQLTAREKMIEKLDE